MLKLVGQRGHLAGIDIRRVADDQVVAIAVQRGKQIGFQHSHPAPQPESLDIVSRDRQCVGRYIHRINLRTRKTDRGGNRNATAASTNVEDATRLERRLCVIAKTARDQVIEARLAGAGEEQRQYHDEIGDGPLDAIV